MNNPSPKFRLSFWFVKVAKSLNTVQRLCLLHDTMRKARSRSHMLTATMTKNNVLLTGIFQRCAKPILSAALLGFPSKKLCKPGGLNF